MSARKASTALRRVPISPALAEKEPIAAAADFEALSWQGAVRLSPDRRGGISAARRQAGVRVGLFERALALGADHAMGPHRRRPEAARRLLAHIDALAEAGTTPAEMTALAADAEIDRAGALWVITLLFGCLEARDTEEAFEAFVDGLDPALFRSYRPVVEIAQALSIAPDSALRAAARRWDSGPRLAIGVEARAPEELTPELVEVVSRSQDPLAIAALERLVARAPHELRPSTPRARWMDVEVPELAFEVARARLLQGDQEPFFFVRMRDARALGALGPYALDVIALAGDATDSTLAREIAAAHPSTPALLDAMGRAGHASLLPRLLADLADDELDDHAHRALTTALGPRVPRASVPTWQQVVSALPATGDPVRLRGGEPHSTSAVLAEMGRADLSAIELSTRADEVLVRAKRPCNVRWDDFGASLEGAVGEIGRLAR